MRLLTCALAALAAIGCDRISSGPPSTPATPTSTSPERPPETRTTPFANRTPVAEPTIPKSTLPGIFKPIPERSTDDLLNELEAPTTKDRLPLLAELAKRTSDCERIRPAVRKLMLDGRYAVRVAAAMVALALDAEHPATSVTGLMGAIDNKFQSPVYGPLLEDTPELRQIQSVAVPGLVAAIEREMDDPKKEHTSAALTTLATMPAEIGKPAANVVKKVAATAMHPFRMQAAEVLKKWVQ